MRKPPEQIKRQLEFWFFKYFNKIKEEFNGKETFTLFEHLDDDLKNKLIVRMGLKSDEIPVFFLKISEGNYLINTTERFLNIKGSIIDSIDYREFSAHMGYKEVNIVRKEGRPIADIKADGLIKEFGIKKKDGTTVYWMIPTGSS